MDISGLLTTERDQLCYFLKTSGGKLVRRNTKLNLFSCQKLLCVHVIINAMEA